MGLLFPCLLLGGVAWHTPSLGIAFSPLFFGGCCLSSPPFGGSALFLFSVGVDWPPSLGGAAFSLVFLRAAAFLLLLWVGCFSPPLLFGGAALPPPPLGGWSMSRPTVTLVTLDVPERKSQKKQKIINSKMVKLF